MNATVADLRRFARGDPEAFVEYDLNAEVQVAAVVHGIVTAHGGRIEVQSELGNGSCFTLHLPRVPSG